MEGVSIFTACKDRNFNLLKVIDSWLNCTNIDEIVIVDWSSTTRVIETLTPHLLNTTKIKIIEVRGQPRWILSWAFNLAARFTRYDKILKLDCDYLLQPEFISQHPLTPTKFFSGDWTIARDNNEKYLNGAVYLYRHNFLAVNGYSEYIQTYGWDDSDLYNRLRLHKLTQQAINNDYISHLAHDTSARQSRDTFNDIHYNRFLVNYINWGLQVPMNSYSYIPSFALLNHLNYMYYIAELLHNNTIVSSEIKDKAQDDLEKYLVTLKQMEIAKTLALEEKLAQEKLELEKKEQEFLEYKHSVIQQLEREKQALKLKKEQAEEDLHCQTHEQLQWIETSMLQLTISQIPLKTKISHTSFSQPNMSIFYINVRNGMGNKLRALASAHTLFEYLLSTPVYNRFPWQMVIIWTPDHHCRAEMDDLFTLESISSTHPNLISVTQNIPSDLPSDTLRLYDAPHVNNEQEQPTNTTIDDFLNKIASSLVPVTIYLESACVLSFPCHNWVQDCQYLQTLQYSKKVHNLLAKITDQLLADNLQLSDLIGLHIRIGQDEQSFDDISGWSQTKQDQWNHWRKNSNYDRFVTAIESELTKGCKGFYLASDTKWVYTKLCEQFPGKIYYLSRDLWDRSDEQVITGLVDVVALTRTKKLLGSNWSSFSELVKRLQHSLPMELAGVHF